MPTGAKLESRVHLQASDGGSAHGREAAKLATLTIKIEVLIPAFSARIEKRDVPALLLIPGTRGVGLVQVAGLAGESQVVHSVGPTG
jgi:hypothetical protein